MTATAEVIHMYTFESARDAINKADQMIQQTVKMGFESVMAAANAGKILIALKEQVGHGKFITRCKFEIPNKSVPTICNYMLFAMNMNLLEQHKPEGHRAALALIKEHKPKKDKKTNSFRIGWSKLLFTRLGVYCARSLGEKTDLEKKLGPFDVFFTDPAAADDFIDRYIRIIGVPKDKLTRAELSAAQQKKFDTICKGEFARLDKLYSDAAKIQVDAEVDRRVAMTREHYKKLNQEAEEIEARYKARIATIDAYMTEDEYKLILNCLHPDRAPEDRRQRFNDAFIIFRRMETYVNRKVPMSTLRERGWAR